MPKKLLFLSKAEPFQCSFHFDFIREEISIKFQSLFNTLYFLMVSNQFNLFISFI